MDKSKKMRVVLVLVLSVVGWAIGIYLVTRETDEARITENGADAEATIVSLVDQHETLHDHRPLIRITVEGDWNGGPHHVDVDRRIDDDELDAFGVGDRVAIRYDPGSPDDIVVLHVAAPPSP